MVQGVGSLDLPAFWSAERRAAFSQKAALCKSVLCFRLGAEIRIELLFKWMKQHLRIKRVMGESENAVRIQLLTTLIAELLVLIDNAN